MIVIEESTEIRASTVLAKYGQSYPLTITLFPADLGADFSSLRSAVGRGVGEGVMVEKLRVCWEESEGWAGPLGVVNWRTPKLCVCMCERRKVILTQKRGIEKGRKLEKGRELEKRES